MKQIVTVIYNTINQQENILLYITNHNKLQNQYPKIKKKNLLNGTR